MTLDVAHLKILADSVTDHHKHIEIAKLNSRYFVKLAINDRPYPWHVHPNSDEVLIVLEGELEIETRDGETSKLGPSDAIHIPKDVAHRTTPLGRAVNLVIEDIDTETVFLDLPGNLDTH